MLGRESSSVWLEPRMARERRVGVKRDTVEGVGVDTMGL